MRLETLVRMIAAEAYQHGEGYAESNICRDACRFTFYHPESRCSFAINELSFQHHRVLTAIYRHFFRAGLSGPTYTNNINYISDITNKYLTIFETEL